MQAGTGSCYLATVLDLGLAALACHAGMCIPDVFIRCSGQG